VGRIEVERERERGPQDKMVRLLQGGWFHDTIASELLGNPLANREHGAPFCKKKKIKLAFCFVTTYTMQTEHGFVFFYFGINLFPEKHDFALKKEH
jgi:hypothetical protein